MPYPYLEAHNINTAGTSRGTYSHVPCPFRNINAAHNAVEIHHSLFEGDRMTFFQILEERGDALDRMRPIRFYTEKPGSPLYGIKLFDGVITDTEYVYVGGDYMALKTNAAGWWAELARMNLHHPITYAEADNWTANDIYMDLVRLANDRSVMKEAIYTYDTDKIPEYAAWDTYFTAHTETEFVVSNIYEGMKTLTRFLDATAPSTFEFGLRIEALPRTTDDLVNPIDQDDTKTAIYILPILLNQDKTTVASFKRFQLEAGANGYNVRRDYHRLANDVLAIGSGFESQQIRTDKILEPTDILSSDEHYSPTNQPWFSHYLRVNIENPQGIPVSGTVAITFDEDDIINTPPDPPTKHTDYLRFDLSEMPARSTTQTRFTSLRSYDRITLPPSLPWGIHVTGFGGWTPAIKISIEEVTSGNAVDGLPSWHTTIAGRSLNTYGHAPKTIAGMWLNSQARVDLVAGKHCRLFHAPTHDLYAPIISRYVNYDNLIGNTAEFYSPYNEAAVDFLITDSVYGFRGNLITQELQGMKYEYEWSFDGS